MTTILSVAILFYFIFLGFHQSKNEAQTICQVTTKGFTCRIRFILIGPIIKTLDIYQM